MIKRISSVLWFIGMSLIAYGNPFQSLFPQNHDTAHENVEETAQQPIYSDVPIFTGFLFLDGNYTAFIRYQTTFVQAQEGEHYPFGTVEKISETEVHLNVNGATKILKLTP